jgi:hypothetical protein
MRTLSPVTPTAAFRYRTVREEEGLAALFAVIISCTHPTTHHGPPTLHPDTLKRTVCLSSLPVYNPLPLGLPHSYIPPYRYQSPHSSTVKLSKPTERTYLSSFFTAISNLYGHLLKRLRRLCRMRVGAFEDRLEPASPPTSTAASGTAREVVNRGPSFDMVVIGCGGGPFETNLSA